MSADVPFLEGVPAYRLLPQKSSQTLPQPTRQPPRRRRGRRRRCDSAHARVSGLVSLGVRGRSGRPLGSCSTVWVDTCFYS